MMTIYNDITLFVRVFLSLARSRQRQQATNLSQVTTTTCSDNEMRQKRMRHAIVFQRMCMAKTTTLRENTMEWRGGSGAKYTLLARRPVILSNPLRGRA